MARKVQRTNVEVTLSGEIDGRSQRATGRPHQFATRIKKETHDEMKRIAKRERITLGDLIERAVYQYKIYTGLT